MDTLVVLVAIMTSFIGFGVGVVINILADAMPVYRRPRRPQYPDGSPRPRKAWSGLIAFLTGLRANEDGARLAWRQPITEIVTALSFGLVVLNWGGERPFIRFVIWLAYLSILILITVIDLEHRLIMFPVIIPTSLFALVLSTAFPAPSRDSLDYVIGGVAGFGLFWFLYYFAAIFAGFMGRLRGREIEEVAFGFGDVMLAGLCGLMIGFPGILVALVIAIFAAGAGAIAYIAMLILSERFQFFAAFPYGPYIAFGTVVVMLWPQGIADFLSG